MQADIPFTSEIPVGLGITFNPQTPDGLGLETSQQMPQQMPRQIPQPQMSVLPAHMDPSTLMPPPPRKVSSRTDKSKRHSRTHIPWPS